MPRMELMDLAISDQQTSPPRDLGSFWCGRRGYPTRLIAENAGEDGSVVIGKLLDKGDFNHGYDAQKGSHVDMARAGIIDSTEVVRLALRGAASVAALHRWSAPAGKAS